MRKIRVAAGLVLSLCSVLGTISSTSQPLRNQEPVLPIRELAAKYFGSDAPWFVRNIPFLDIDDSELQQVYYYRWKLYRSHIREIGPQGTTVLEFLGDVPWAREPFTDLNDSSSFHLMEGRWLRDPEVVDDLIDHLYMGGANDRHFSESIAAATESTILVTGDAAPALRHLDTMQHIYNLWDDHFDRQRNLYWIEPLLDATEYTISSIDASGAGFTDQPSKDQNHNGFTGGFAFRPSINSYQYANALAIAHLARLADRKDVAAEYTQRAQDIREAVLTQLWNPTLNHFTDRYQRSTKYVTVGDFIRGRELVGYVPWMYELPPTDPISPSNFDQAWKHIASKSELAGSYGLRTVEPSYPRYLTQYRYDQTTSLPECQWNGPSWPFQSSQVLTAMANLLDDYPESAITADDYVHLLRQYARQHFDDQHHLDLQEDYNPDTGKPIVGLPRSHHYNHSTFVDLILSGLIGIRPRADNVLEVDPLLPSSAASGERPIRYFAITRVRYHSHDLSVIYDADGNRYHVGRGLSVYVDGQRVAGPVPLGRLRVQLPKPAKMRAPVTRRVDLAANPGVKGLAVATASSAESPESIAQGIDGRMWFFPEIANGWSPLLTDGPKSWYAVDLGKSQRVGSVQLYFFADGDRFKPPTKVWLEYRKGDAWQPVSGQNRTPAMPLANGETLITFPGVEANTIRVEMENPAAPSRLRMVEFEAFAPSSSP